MKHLFCLALCLVSIIFIAGCSLFIVEEPIGKSTSPEGSYAVEAFLVNGGATVDYSVKVYLTYPSKKLIYNKYKQKTVSMSWNSDKEICINGVSLDLSKGESYDWRNE